MSCYLNAKIQVILLDLEVLSDICTGPVGATLSIETLQLLPAARESLAGRSPYFVQLLLSLLDMFKGESTFLLERGSFIIRYQPIVVIYF